MQNSECYGERGKGFCGSIWARDSDKAVIKREDGGPGRSVEQDHQMHLRILKEAAAALLPVAITKSFGIIQPIDPFWQRELSAFPCGFEPCCAYRTDLIPAMTRDVREWLIDQYCPPELRDFVRTNPAD